MAAVSKRRRDAAGGFVSVQRFSSAALLAAGAVSGLAWQPAAQAVDLEWEATGALLFYDTAANWDPDSGPTGPTDADNLTFSIDLGGSPIVLGSPSNGLDLDFTDNAWTFTGAGGANLDTEGTTTVDDLLANALGNGAQLTFTGGVDWDNALDVLVGEAGYGTLTYEGGGSARVQTVYVGRQLGAEGELNVTGSGTLFQTDGPDGNFGFFIGEDGTGTLNVINGATARIVNDTSGGIADFVFGRNATGNGTGNIDGVGTQIIAEDVFVGNSGTGSLNITNGAALLQNIGGSPDAFVGSVAGSTGSVVVNGDGSRWASSRTEIGNNGSGTLSVEAGGLVESGTTAVDDMIIGDQATAAGSVAVFGSEGGNASRLTSTRDIYVGLEGLGELRVGQDLTGSTAASGGFGELSVASDLRVGTGVANAFDNKAIFDGANVTATIGDVLFAGENGTGTVEIRNGATVNSARPRVGSGVDSDGTLLVTGTGSTLTATNDFVVGTSGTGVATVSDGATVNNFGFFWVGFQGNADGTLTIDDATVNAQTGNTEDFIIGGRTDGSGGTGLVTVQNGGRLNVANEGYIGGNTTGSGRLVVTGAGSIYDHEDGSVNDILRIGHTGEGFAEVREGGEMITEAIQIGNGSGSAAADLLVTGNGSTVSTNGQLLVGNTRPGTMTVSDGAQVTVADTANAADVNTRRLLIGNGGGADGSRLTVTGAGTRLDYLDSERLSVGFNGGSTSNRALLEILDGGVVQLAQPGEALADQGFIMVGDESGGNGQIDVRGAGSLLEGRFLNLGDASASSSGIANVTQGGRIKLNDFSEVGANGTGNSTLNVSDAGSRYEVGGDFSIGAGGVGTNGTFNLSDGGVITTGDQGFVGRNSGSNGTANVGDASPGDNGNLASWIISNSLYIAGSANLAVNGSQTSGSGTLNITENGLVDVTGQTVIKDRGTVTLNGGELATDTLLFQDFAERTGSPTFNFNTGTLRFTQNGGNTLDAALLNNIFDNGPHVLSIDQHLAVEGVTVFGDEVRVNGGTLSLGNIAAANFQQFVDFDAGTLNLTNTSIVVTNAGLFGSALVIDDDQTVNTTGSFFVQPDGLLSVARGTLSAGDGSNEGNVVIAEGTATFAGEFENNGDLVLIDATFNGTIDNDGDLTVVGTSSLDALTLGTTGGVAFAVGTDAGAPDRLDVAGSVSVDGGLTVTADFPLIVSAGDTFDLITAASVSGQFSSVSLPTLSAGLGFNVLYEANRVALAVVNLGVITGDYDGSGQVEQGDLDIVLQNWGTANFTGDESALVGGGPFDGQVDQNELDGVLQNWGSTATPDFTGSAVPEPAAFALLGVGALWLRRR